MIDESASYVATFLCGHARSYPLADARDKQLLQDSAGQRRCPECALSDHLRARSEDRVAS